MAPAPRLPVQATHSFRPLAAPSNTGQAGRRDTSFPPDLVFRNPHCSGLAVLIDFSFLKTAYFSTNRISLFCVRVCGRLTKEHRGCSCRVGGPCGGGEDQASGTGRGLRVPWGTLAPPTRYGLSEAAVNLGAGAFTRAEMSPWSQPLRQRPALPFQSLPHPRSREIRQDLPWVFSRERPAQAQNIGRRMHRFRPRDGAPLLLLLRLVMSARARAASVTQLGWAGNERRLCEGLVAT